MRVRKDALAMLNHSQRLHDVCPFCAADEEHITCAEPEEYFAGGTADVLGGIRLSCKRCQRRYVVGWKAGVLHSHPVGYAIVVRMLTPS